MSRPSPEPLWAASLSPEDPARPLPGPEGKQEGGPVRDVPPSDSGRVLSWVAGEETGTGGSGPCLQGLPETLQRHRWRAWGSSVKQVQSRSLDTDTRGRPRDEGAAIGGVCGQAKDTRTARDIGRWERGGTGAPVEPALPTPGPRPPAPDRQDGVSTVCVVLCHGGPGHCPASCDL